jgi:hypothetical protein
MTEHHAWQRPLLAALAALALMTALAIVARPAPLRADSSPRADTSSYTLDWWTVDGGGQSGPAASGYTLEGTIGQPDAAPWQGGEYTLSGGFWLPTAGPVPETYWVYLPLVTR